MPVELVQCQTPEDLKKFVQFPYDLYKHNAYWVPPLKKQEFQALQVETNPALRSLQTKFWIATISGKVVGRTGAIINTTYNQKTGEKLCRLTRTEFIDDKNVSKALFGAAEAWAKEMGMTIVHGPLGFTNLDHQAVLIEGFDYLPSIASEYHLPYYKSHFEEAGYDKEMDWLEFRLKLDAQIPEKVLKMNELIQRRYGLKVVAFQTKKQLRAYAMKILLLLNIAFGSLFSFVDLDDDMKDFYINKYFNFLNPKFVKVVENKEGEVIGFIVTMPSLSKAMQRSKGKLFPMGWFHISQALKKSKTADILLTGIHPDWQAQGVIAILITEAQKAMMEHGVEHVETTGIIEINDKAINHWKNYDHIQHKRKRCFRKELDG